MAFTGAGALVAAAVLVHGHREPLPYPQQGSIAATRYAERHVGSDGVVIVSVSPTFSFMASTRIPLEVVATPDHQVGFAPHYLDDRFHTMGGWAPVPDSPARLERITERAGRVLVMGGGWAGYNHVKWLSTGLAEQGFVRTDTVVFGTETIDIWTPAG